MIILLKMNFLSHPGDHKAPGQHISLVLSVSFRTVSLMLDMIFVIPKREMPCEVGFYRRQFDIFKSTSSNLECCRVSVAESRQKRTIVKVSVG